MLKNPYHNLHEKNSETLQERAGLDFVPSLFRWESAIWTAPCGNLMAAKHVYLLCYPLWWMLHTDIWGHPTWRKPLTFLTKTIQNYGLKRV